MTKLKMVNHADPDNPQVLHRVPPVRGGQGAPPERKFGGLTSDQALAFLEVAMTHWGQAVVIRDYMVPDEKYLRVILTERVSYNRQGLQRFLLDHANGAFVTLASRVTTEVVDGETVARGRLYLTVRGKS